MTGVVSPPPPPSSPPPPSPLPLLFWMRTQPEGSHLQTKGSASTRHLLCQHLVLDFPPPGR